MKKTFTILIAALAAILMMAQPKMVMGQSDVIDRSVTSSYTSNTGITAWTDFEITGGTSGVKYQIHSMGSKNSSDNEALRWNANGYLYMKTTYNGYKLKKITITTTANKNINVYAQNQAYSAAPSGTALATLAATSSGASYTFESDYTHLALKGTASSTLITNITIEWEANSGPATYTVTYAVGEHGSGTMTDDNSPYEEGDEVTLLNNAFEPAEGYIWDSWLVKDEDDNVITVTDGKFDMPASNVTVTAQWVVDPSAPTYEWVETALADLGASDIFVIVGNNSYAMASTLVSNTQPAAVSITVANGKISGSPNNNLKWNVTGNSTDGFIFHPNGDATNYLYCNTTASSGSNTNMRIGTQSSDIRNLYVLSDNHLVTKDNWTNRYVHLNGSTDWRGYVSSSTSSTTVKFYKRQVVSTNPIIYASNVDIAYNVTSGSIDYTLENATGNVSADITSGNWLTLGTITSSAVPFTCAENTGAERTATVTLSFSGADNKVVTVTQAASPARYTTIPDLFAGATATATDVLVTFNNWVVSGVSTNGKNVFVTDNAGNGFIIYKSDGSLVSTYAVGNILSGTAVPCSLKLNNGYAQLTSLDAADLSITTGGTVSTANIAMASLAGINTGALVSYEGLTCSVDNSGNTTKYYLSNGTTTLQVYTSLYDFTTDSELVSGHKYSITGIYQQYGEIKELLPRKSADIVEVFTPAISATPTSLTDFTYVFDNGPSTTRTVSVSGANLTADITLSLGNNSDFEMSTTEGSGYTNSLTLTQSEGSVAATTVYVRLKAGLAVGNSYSGTITLTSTGASNASVSLSGSVTEPIVDYATLPFNYEGGVLDDFLGMDGTSHSLNDQGSYAEGNAPYRIKFTATGDYLQVKTNEQPGAVSIGVKMLGGSTTSTITVQGSADGVTFTNIQELSISGSQNDIVNLETTQAFAATDRYVRLYFNKGSNVGVGPISIAAYVAPGNTTPVWSELPTPTIAVNAEYELDLSNYVTGTPTPTITLATSVLNNLYEFDNGLLVFQPTAAGTYEFTFTATNSEGNASATLTVTAVEAATYTLATAITSGRHYVIAASTSNVTKAMGGKNASKTYYDAIDASIDGNTITVPANSEIQEFVIVGPNVDGYYYIYDLVAGGYLYASSSSSNDLNYQTQNDANGLWEIDFTENTVTAKGTNTRNLLRYNSDNPRFSCYATGQTAIAFYEKNETTPQYDFYVDIAAWTVTQTAGENKTDGWYFIASPLESAYTLTGADMVSGTYEDYDLYRLNNTTWENYNNNDHSDFIALNNGTGYLYANSSNITLHFSGAVNEFTTAGGANVKSLSEGWNLVGNPYNIPIYINKPYYKMNAAGNEVEAGNTSTAIPACTGVIVNASENESVTFSTTAPESATNNNGFIQMSVLKNNVRGNDVQDKAIVSFNEGSKLEKFQLFEGDTKIYFPMEDADYAIVSSDGHGTMPVNFKAKEMGRYTISVETEGIDMSYLHLIDRLTGEDVNLLLDNEYSFIASNNDSEERFILSFTEKGYDAHGNEIFVYQSGNDLIVNGEGELQIFDVMGRMVKNTVINGVEAIAMPQGVYIFRLNENIQKIVVR